jgi:hypothetical protein
MKRGNEREREREGGWGSRAELESNPDSIEIVFYSGECRFQEYTQEGYFDVSIHNKVN